jgi:hypothetical protein
MATVPGVRERPLAALVWTRAPGSGIGFLKSTRTVVASPERHAEERARPGAVGCTNSGLAM